VASDTATSPGSSGSVSASRMTFMAGNAVRGAAAAALERWQTEERPASAEYTYLAPKTTPFDPETGVRCVAAAALCKLHQAGTVAKILDAFRVRPEFQFENAVVSVLANMPAARTPEILVGCSDKDAAVRRAAARAFAQGLRRNESVPALLKALNDSDPSVRFYAANALARFPRRRDVADALVARISDPHPSVRNRAALAVAACFRSHSGDGSARQLAAVRRLSRLFRQSTASDDWSFRPVGHALAELGPRGRDALRRFMDQRQDKTLADRAWRILYAPQTGWRYALCTEKEALEGYRLHPLLAGWKPVKAPDARGRAGAKHTVQVLRVDYPLTTEHAAIGGINPSHR